MNNLVLKNQLDFNFTEKVIGNKIFRPIHYIGSKLRMLDFITKVVDEVEPSHARVCDLFSGSGSVSFKLSKSRPVTSIDIQEYSRIICSAIINPSSDFSLLHYEIDNLLNYSIREKLFWATEPLIFYERDCATDAVKGNLNHLSELLESGSLILFEKQKKMNLSKELNNALEETYNRLKGLNFLNNSMALVTRYFGGIFFSYEQAIEIDHLLDINSKLPSSYQNTFLAAILSTTSDIVNTVGKQFAQPIKPRRTDGSIKLNLSKKILKDRSFSVSNIFKSWLDRYMNISNTGFENFVEKMDYLEALNNLSNDTKIIYADPPYTRDHYSRYYHVLETLCLRDNPDLSTMKINGETRISRGLYRKNRYQSPFCIKSQVEMAFEKLFSKTKELDIPLLLSYSPYDQNVKSRPRLLKIELLLLKAKKYFKYVDVVSPGTFSHSKLNHSRKNFDKPDNAELIIICLPR